MFAEEKSVRRPAFPTHQTSSNGMAPSTETASPHVGRQRHRGRLVEWRADKGYGFVQHGRQRLFVHIRDFAERHVPPEAGACITYAVGADLRGRPCAQEVLQPNDGGRIRAVHLLVLALLLATPGIALARIEAPGIGGAIATISLLSSAATYGFYRWDKHRARQRDWRIKESMLHFWEFFGGWPGAFLAQRHLRHKTSKGSYLFVFWLIVAAQNYVALDSLLHWRLSLAAREKIQNLLQPPPPPPPAKSKVY